MGNDFAGSVPPDLLTDHGKAIGEVGVNVFLGFIVIGGAFRFALTAASFVLGKALDEGWKGEVSAAGFTKPRGNEDTALKKFQADKLGQFLSATPLSAGTYTIETESESAVFEPLRLDLKKEIVPPIAITAEG